MIKGLLLITDTPSYASKGRRFFQTMPLGWRMWFAGMLFVLVSVGFCGATPPEAASGGGGSQYKWVDFCEYMDVTSDVQTSSRRQIHIQFDLQSVTKPLIDGCVNLRFEKPFDSRDRVTHRVNGRVRSRLVSPVYGNDSSSIFLPVDGSYALQVNSSSMPFVGGLIRIELPGLDVKSFDGRLELILEIEYGDPTQGHENPRLECREGGVQIVVIESAGLKATSDMEVIRNGYPGSIPHTSDQPRPGQRVHFLFSTLYAGSITDGGDPSDFDLLDGIQSSGLSQSGTRFILATPNPAYEHCLLQNLQQEPLQVCILDVLGRVHSQVVIPEGGAVDWDVLQLKPGLYFVCPVGLPERALKIQVLHH